MDPRQAPNILQGQTLPHATAPVPIAPPPPPPVAVPTAQQQPLYQQPNPQQALPQQQYQQPMRPATPQQMIAPQQPLPPVAPVVNPNSTQNALLVSEVRDGIVIMNDGTFRSVVMCKSINFDLMSPQEREGVEYGYQGFLNSLYFDIQIFIRSQKVDLRPYLEKLDKIKAEHDNMLLALLMEDYISYMENLSYQTNIMDKRFYVIIPYSPNVLDKGAVQASKTFAGKIMGDFFKNKKQQIVINEVDLEKAKAELRNRVQATLGGLLQCGVQGIPLDTQELIELFYDAYNPDTATRQQLKDFNQLTAPVVTKGTGSAPSPHLDRELL